MMIMNVVRASVLVLLVFEGVFACTRSPARKALDRPDSSNGNPRCELAFPATGGPWLEFTHSGGRSRIDSATVSIEPGAGVSIRISKRVFQKGHKSINYTTVLQTEELEHLKDAICTSGFFTLPETVGERFAKDAGTGRLRIALGPKERTLKTGRRPELRPLMQMLWSLISQAEILDDLPNDIYAALGAVDEHLMAERVLQPAALTGPFKEFVKTSNDPQAVIWALEGLSWTVTPMEWGDFVSSQVKTRDPLRRELFLMLVAEHNFASGIRATHREALRELYLQLLWANANQATHSSNEETALRRLCEHLAETRYSLALPYFTHLVEDFSLMYPTDDCRYLGKMGVEGLVRAAQLLTNARPQTRVDATESVLIAARLTSRAGLAFPFEPGAHARLSETLKKVVLPTLDKMSQDDPVEILKKRAAEVASEIRKEMAK